MSLISRIDDTVISGFERVLHPLQRWFGIEARHCERVCASAAFICVALEFPHKVGAFDKSIGCFLALTYVGRIISTWADNPRGTSNVIALNPERLRHRLTRVFCLALALFAGPMDFIKPGYYPWFEFSVFGWYFSCCTDLPPGVSKARKFLDSLRASMASREKVSAA